MACMASLSPELSSVICCGAYASYSAWPENLQTCEDDFCHRAYPSCNISWPLPRQSVKNNCHRTTRWKDYREENDSKRSKGESQGVEDDGEEEERLSLTHPPARLRHSGGLPSLFIYHYCGLAFPAGRGGTYGSSEHCVKVCIRID